MDGIVPYAGISLVIAVGAGAAVALSFRGVYLRRVRHRATEVEFANHRNPLLVSPPVKPRIPAPDAVLLRPKAEADCSALGIDGQDLRVFVAREAEGHVRLFGAPFVSLPFVFREWVLLVSWDGAVAAVERALNRSAAYPLNDTWIDCLTRYRRATTLDYRLHGEQSLVNPVEAGRTVRELTELVRAVKVLQEQAGVAQGRYPSPRVLEQFLDEAVFAIDGGRASSAIVAMESLLSTIHKLLIELAPAAGTANPLALDEAESLPPPSAPDFQVLVVEDYASLRNDFHELLTSAGYRVVSVSNARDAMKVLTTYPIPLLVVDIMLADDCSNMDGREVVRAARAANPNVKVLVLSAQSRIDVTVDLFKIGVDAYLLKGDLRSSDELVENVSRLLADDESQAESPP